MMKSRFYCIMLSVALSVFVLGAGVGQADNIGQMAISAKALGKANTCTADPPGTMAIHYNPAGLTRLKGTQIDVGMTYMGYLRETGRYIAPPGYDPVGTGAPDPIANTESTTHKANIHLPNVGWMSPVIAPNLGMSHQPAGSRWTFAYGIYAPFGIGVQNDGASRYSAQRKEEARIIYASPTVAYKATDSLSLGASVGFGYSEIGATLYARAPNSTTGALAAAGVISDPYATLAKFDVLGEDDMTVSYNVGVLYQPLEWLSFGAVYQSECGPELKGRYEWRYTEDFKRAYNYTFTGDPNSGLAKDMDTGEMNWSADWPKRVQAGIMVKPFKSLKLLCDWHWIDYRCKQADIIDHGKNIQMLELASALGYGGGANKMIIERHWEQKNHFSYAIEWQALKSLCLRVGYEPRKTVIPDKYYELTYPLSDLDIYTIGAGIDFSDRLTVDLAVAYVYNDDHRIPANTSKVLNSSAEGAGMIYNPYSGLDYEQKTEAIIPSINVSYKW